MTWFLDTNVCIDLLRGRARGRRLPPYHQCQLSSIVAAELWTGAHKSGNPEQTHHLQTFLGLFHIAPFDAAAAREYGEVRAELERAGNPIGPLDQLIAAHARSMNATLVTANLREFQRVSRLRCLAWN